MPIHKSNQAEGKCPLRYVAEKPKTSNQAEGKHPRRYVAE